MTPEQYAVEVWYYIWNGCSHTDSWVSFNPYCYYPDRAVRTSAFRLARMLPPTPYAACAEALREMKPHLASLGFNANIRTGEVTYVGH